MGTDNDGESLEFSPFVFPSTELVVDGGDGDLGRGRGLGTGTFEVRERYDLCVGMPSL